ncbi:MAG TPA: ISL3 family transposase [Proteobacteria bacterium]|nr:ISL3 family transposase [Pseudomonadota bacterium]
MRIYSIKKALNIPEYKITGIISETDKEINIKLEPYKRKPFICSGCGQVHKIGRHATEESIAEDLSLFEKRVYLTIVKRRFKCPVDNRTHIEEIPWLKKYGRVTRRFAEKVNRLTAITTNQEAGWFLGLDDEAVYRIDKEILEQQYAQRLIPPPAAVNISVDEVSYRKYHRYLTNVVNTDEKAIIWNDKGRRTEVLDRYYTAIGEDNCKKIESVALDGARTYIASTNHYAVNATIVYDRFHVMQKLNWAVDMVRKQELRKARKDEDNELIELMNCRQRFILLKNKANLTDKQTGYLERLCKANEPIYKAMLLKESFLELYNYDIPEEAERYLRGWIKEALASSLDMFKKIALSFLDKIQYIINWFKKKISSAISEGINNKIKRLKRMAYGYKDIEYFKLKIHQHCGLLNPRRYSH